jgi:preprotein translocase subunit SecD
MRTGWARALVVCVAVLGCGAQVAHPPQLVDLVYAAKDAQAAAHAVERRLAAGGLHGVHISSAGDRLHVQVTAGEAGRAKDLLARVGRVTIGSADPSEASITLQPVTTVDIGDHELRFTLAESDARVVQALTTALVGQRLLISIDGRVVAAPVVRDPVTGGALRITFTPDEPPATDLAAILSSGPLPEPLRLVQ